MNILRDLASSSLSRSTSTLSEPRIFSVSFIISIIQDFANNRDIALRLLWLFFCILAIVITGSIISIGYCFNVVRPTVLLAIILWAIFLGATALFFLPGKAITAVFGGSVGVSMSEIRSGTGLISSLNKGVTDLAREVGAILSPGASGIDPFIATSVWAFILIFTLVCLPAFFLSDATPQQSS